ncbi:MAG: flagellar hook-length control protein FliK [Pseudomonadota bacterium]
MSAESLLSVIASVPAVSGAAQAAPVAEGDASAFEGMLAEVIGGGEVEVAPAEGAKQEDMAASAPVIALPVPMSLPIFVETAPTTDGTSHTGGTAPVPGTGSDFTKLLEDSTGPQIWPDPVETQVEICPPADQGDKTSKGPKDDAETRPTLPPAEQITLDELPLPFKFAKTGLPVPGGPSAPAQTFPPPVEPAPTTKTTGRKDGREVLPGPLAVSADAPVIEASGPPASPSAAAQVQPDPAQSGAPPAASALKTAAETLGEAPLKPLDPASSNATATAPAEKGGVAPADVQAASLSSLSRATIETTAHLAAQITRKLEGRSTRFEMALTPEGLGRVDVSLDIDADGQLAARLAFDNPVAAMDLRGRVDELRRQLEDQGFKLADDALQFTDRDPQSRGDGFDGRRERAFARSNRLNDDADLEISTPVAGRWMSISLTPDRVDLKV